MRIINKGRGICQKLEIIEYYEDMEDIGYWIVMQIKNVHSRFETRRIEIEADEINYAANEEVINSGKR